MLCSKCYKKIPEGEEVRRGGSGIYDEWGDEEAQREKVEYFAFGVPKKKQDAKKDSE